MSENTKTLIIVSILAVLMVFIEMKCSDEKIRDIVTKVDTLYIDSKDTQHNITPTISPKQVYITNNYTYEASIGPIDTGAVLRDYFSRKGYIDTIKNDSIDLFLHEEVYKNELFRKKVAYKWKAKERIIKESTTKTIYPNSVSFGLAPGYYFLKPTIGFYGDYQTKEMKFGLIIDPIAKGGSVIISKKINFKK